MPATPLVPTTRFFQRGISKVYFVPAIASASLNVTRAEIDAGTDLTKEVADMSGWLVRSKLIPTPDLASVFTSNIGGPTESEASSISFYASKNGNDARVTLPRGTTGFVVWCDGGDVTAYKADVFPVEVTSVGKARSLDDRALVIPIDFAITDEPAEDITLPATA